MSIKRRKLSLERDLPVGAFPELRFSFWKLGEKSRLARVAGISPQSLGDILARRRSPRKDLAAKLEIASGVVLGNRRRIPAAEWRTNDISDHPAFYSSVEEEEKGIERP